VDVTGAVIGEKWRIGSSLVLVPTFGRIPCATFQAKMDEPRWIKRFTEANRTGAYLRVVEPGPVQAGDPIEVVDRPAHGVTIERAFRAWMLDASRLRELLEVEGLPEDLRASVRKRLKSRA
jgi:MOSC domain-containing protein YiiM